MTTAAPFGALPVGTHNGGMPHKGNEYAIASGYATAIYEGDFVKIVAGGGIEKDAGTTTATPVGIFMGCKYTGSDGTPTWSRRWPASTVAADAKAFVADDPDLEFEMQASGSIAAADVGQNAAIVQTAGTAVIPKSKNALDQATLNTTNTLPLRILRISGRGNNAAGDAFTNVICRFNTAHQITGTTGV